MLAKKQRLSKEEIELIFKKGFSISVRHFFIRSRKNHLDRSRFSIVFDKKISLKSHERILIRRRIYEAIRKNQEILKTPADITYIVKPSLLQEKRKNVAPCVREGLETLDQHYQKYEQKNSE